MMAHATNVWLIAAAWMLLAFVASVVSIRAGISVALIEIGMGVLGGNFLGLQTSEWVNTVRDMRPSRCRTTRWRWARTSS